MATASGHLNRSSRDFGRYEIRAPPSLMLLSARFRTVSAMTLNGGHWSRKKDRDNSIIRVERRHFELCVFSRMMLELKSGDLAICGSDPFTDTGPTGFGSRTRKWDRSLEHHKL